MTDEYYKEHKCCPECGKIKFCSNETYVICDCGWSGLVDDLIPDRMSAKRLRDIYKNDIKVDSNKPETWDVEMVADYIIWLFQKKSSTDVEKIMDIVLEKLK